MTRCPLRSRPEHERVTSVNDSSLRRAASDRWKLLWKSFQRRQNSCCSPILGGQLKTSHSLIQRVVETAFEICEANFHMLGDVQAITEGQISEDIYGMEGTRL